MDVNAVALALMVGIAQAGAPAKEEICLVRKAAAVAGVTDETLQAAWAIRRAVDGLDGELRTVDDTRDCRPDTTLWVALDDAGGVTLEQSRWGEALAWHDSVDGLEPETRSRAIAQAIAAALATLAEQRREGQGDVVIDLGRVTESTDKLEPEPAAAPRQWTVGLSAGAQVWTGTPTQGARFGGDTTLVAAHLGTGFVLGLAASWWPPADVDGAVPARAWTAAGAAVAGWQTPNTDGLGARLLGGAGLEWRGLTASPLTRLDTVEVLNLAPFVAAEAMLAWSMGSDFEADLGVSARFYPAGTEYTLAGGVVSAAAPASAAATIRLCWWFY